MSDADRAAQLSRRDVAVAIAVAIAATLAIVVGTCSSGSPASSEPLSETDYLAWCIEFAEERAEELNGSRTWQHVARVIAVAQLIAEAGNERAPDTVTGRLTAERINELISLQSDEAELRLRRGPHWRVDGLTPRTPDQLMDAWVRVAESCKTRSRLLRS